MKRSACILGLVLAGCTVGPDYQAPVAKVNAGFSEMAPSSQPSVAVAGPVAGGKWWMTFGDRELDRLIERALAGNLDFQQAQSRLRQSRYQQMIAGAAVYPELNADGGYNHARGSKNVTIPAGAFGAGKSVGHASLPRVRPDSVTSTSGGGATGAGGVAGPQSPLGQGGLPGVTTDVYQVGFDASWEIDVFGGRRRGIEAANADEAAAVEDARAAAVSLAAEVARNYVALRGFQRQAAIARENLGIQEDTLGLTRDKYQHGFVTQLDVARQAAEVALTAAAIPPLEYEAHETIHTLGILLGQDPGSLAAELSAAAPIPPLPPTVPVGIPADLLRRRPDIRRAERELAGATARVGVATADLYPKFTITGLLGLDSTKPEHLFDYSSHYYSFVPGVTWPIFDAGKIQDNIHVQDEAARQAEASYQETVLTALKEVEDSLAAYRTQQLRREALIDAVTASREALDLARQQYQQGVSDFLTVLDAQRALLGSEDSLVQSQQAVSGDLVALYKALGGGWE